MKFDKFSPVTGNDLTIIQGQSRYGVDCQDSAIDIYDLTTEKYWQKHPFPGNQLVFFDFQTGQKFEPISSKENQFFFSVIYQYGYFYFLHALLKQDQLTLFKYLPGQEPEIIHQMPLTGLHTHNLSLVYDKAHVWIASFDDNIDFYYPQKFSVVNEPDQTLLFIDDDKLYFEQDSDFYSDNEYEHVPDRIIIKDFNDHILSNMQGNIILLSNDKWQKVNDSFILPYWCDQRPLAGQDQYWVTISDYVQFEDLRDDYWQTRIYPGNRLIFFDQKTGKAFSPFSVQPNVCYGEPIFNDGFFYFTQVNTKSNELHIFKYQPEKEAKVIFTCSLNAVNLHNLRLISSDDSVQLVSDNDQGTDTKGCTVKGYFPDKFAITYTEDQIPLFMKNHQLYLSDYEERYNGNGDFIKYVYYTCSKDLSNKLISKKLGSFNLAPDGKWWQS